MLKIVGFGLLGLFALMILPSGVSSDVNPMFYGTATMVLADPNGNTLMAQTVHNRITDQGEEFIMDQVFDRATAAATDFNRVGAICIISNSDSVFSETATDSTTNNIAGGTNHCHQSTSMTTPGDSTTVTGATVFTSGTDFDSGQTISGILICQKNGNDNDFAECSTPGDSTALAALDLANVTASGTDTVTITYTFDITTSGT